MESTMIEETKTKVESSVGDLSDVENGNCSSSGSGGDTKKTCVDCGTSRTPLWRGGPAGPKSLCNACGIKSRKKRQAASGISQEDSKIKKKNSIDNNLVLENHRTVKFVKPESVNVVVKSKMVKAETKPESGNVVKNKMSMKKDSESCNGKKKNVKKVNRFLDLGFKVPVMKRSSIEKKRLWRKLGEEEQAAVLLMTLSCG